MRSTYLYGLLALTVLLSGCVVRSYPMERDRVDQDLSAGNRGYLQGTAPAETTERKSTRTTHVVEIEMFSPVKIDKGPKSRVAEPASYTAATEEPWAEEEYVTESEAPAMEEAVATTFEKYTVQKGDTLQKISQKYFGTTRRWMKIYEANKDVLKGPDKIYVGQVLNIPMEGDTLKKIK